MKDKLGSLFTIILTHSIKRYIETTTNPPEVIITRRSSTPQIYLFEKILKRRGVKIIFDLDDAIFLHSSNLLGINVRPGSFYLEHIIQNANMVTTNGHFLMSFAKNFNEKTTIIFDPIDTELFNPKQRI